MKNKTKKQKHLAVVGIIFDRSGKVLLTQRDEVGSTHSHLKWQFPGGGIEFGEHPLDTLRREVMEETGIEILTLTEQPIVHSHIFQPENIHALVMGFPSIYKSGKIDVNKDKNTGDAKWFSFEEINAIPHLPEVKNMIREARKFLK